MDVIFPLTPALSPREREPAFAALETFEHADLADRAEFGSPSPLGERVGVRGEGTMRWSQIHKD